MSKFKTFAMKKHLLFFILLITSASFINGQNNIMGGDMAYKKVGQDSFLITVNSYKESYLLRPLSYN